MKIALWVLAMLSVGHAAAEVYHHALGISQENVLQYEYAEEETPPFTELIVSWNAMRPLQGKYAIYVSLKTSHWSPRLLYAVWAAQEQLTFSETASDAAVQVFQDAAETIGPIKACGFKIYVEALEGAELTNFEYLHACAADMTEWHIPKSDGKMESIVLPVIGLSQMLLTHPRAKDMCSPTSTTAVIRYLKNDWTIDPLAFAAQIHDDGFDIYGNWVLNTAQACAYLGIDWTCWVARLKGFEEIHARLIQGTPVVISVRSPLPGSAMTYSSGHLIAVIGYDSETDEAICMDPAFDEDAKTHVRYKLDDLMQAWARRKNIAYVFQKQ